MLSVHRSIELPSEAINHLVHLSTYSYNHDANVDGNVNTRPVCLQMQLQTNQDKVNS